MKTTISCSYKTPKFALTQNTNSMKSEIILYDNYYLYLEAFPCFLDKNGFTEMYDYKSTVEFSEIENLVSEDSSVVIMNIAAVSINDAMEIVEKLLSLNEHLKIMILSPNAEVRNIKKFFDKGVKSFLTKHTHGHEFLNALKEVMDGKVYISEETKNSLYNFICNIDDQQDKKANGIEDLTSREIDVLHQICEGLRSKEIAERLFISKHTVESHRRNIMMKLDVHNSSMLVKFAMDNRLVN